MIQFIITQSTQYILKYFYKIFIFMINVKTVFIIYINLIYFLIYYIIYV